MNINDFFIGNFSKGGYYIDNRNFSYPFRFGDYIGLCCLSKFIKYLNPSIRIEFRVQTHQYINNNIKYFSYFDRIKYVKNQLPLFGNLWTYYYYIHMIANKLKINLDLQSNMEKIVNDNNYIVINPMFDAEYDKHRIWKISNINSLYDECKKTKYENIYNFNK